MKSSTSRPKADSCPLRGVHSWRNRVGANPRKAGTTTRNPAAASARATGRQPTGLSGQPCSKIAVRSPWGFHCR